MPHRLKHPAHLLVAAFADLHFDAGGIPAAIGADHPRARRQRPLTEERYAGAQLLQRFRVRDPADIRHIDLRHPVTGVGHLLREGTIIREDEQPFRLGIQPAHRMETGHGSIAAAEFLLQRGDDQLHHRVRHMGVVTRGHVPLGFVQQNVEVLDVPGDRLSVYRDVIALRVDPQAELTDHLTIDRYFPIRDQALGFAPRGDAGACENFLQPLLHIEYLARGARG